MAETAAREESTTVLGQRDVSFAAAGSAKYVAARGATEHEAQNRGAAVSRDAGIRRQDAGWVTVLAGDGCMLARGQLHLGQLAESGQPTRWGGRLDSLRVGAGGKAQARTLHVHLRLEETAPVLAAGQIARPGEVAQRFVEPLRVLRAAAALQQQLRKRCEGVVAGRARRRRRVRVLERLIQERGPTAGLVLQQVGVGQQRVGARQAGHDLPTGKG